MKDKHTPLPWTMNLQPNETYKSVVALLRRRNGTTIGINSNEIETCDDTEANAALIVHRVNNFERLEKVVLAFIDRADGKLSYDEFVKKHGFGQEHLYDEAIAAAKQNK